jgi:hypothetical protein
VAKLKYLEMTVKNKNRIHDKIKSTINLRYAVQNVLSFCLLSGKLGFRIYNNVISTVFNMGVKLV